MVRLTVEEQKDYPTLPVNSIVHVKIENVEQRTVQGGRNGSWEKLEFKMKVLQVLSTGDSGIHVSNFDNLIGEFIFGSTPTKITDSQENKLRLWAEAILNRPIELGFELDTDYFLNREARAVTSQYEKRAINPVTQQPFIGHQVASMLAMGGTVTPGGVPGGAAPAAAPPAPAQSWTPPAGQPDPWAPQQSQAPAAGDPWAAQPQAPAPQAAPVQQAPAQQEALPVGAAGGQQYDDPDEPGF